MGDLQRVVIVFVLAQLLTLIASACFFASHAQAGVTEPAEMQQESFSDLLEDLNFLHAEAVSQRLEGLDPAGLASTLDAADLAGIPLDRLMYTKSRLGVLRSIRGLDVRLPVSNGSFLTDPGLIAMSFLSDWSAIFGVAIPNLSFDIDRVTASKDGLVHVKLTQNICGLPVFGSQINIHLNPDLTVRGFLGKYLPDWASPSCVDLQLQTLGVVEDGATVVTAEIGYYHGDLFGDSSAEWGSAEAVLAHRILIWSHDTAMERFVAVHDGSLLLERPDSDRDELLSIYYMRGTTTLPGPYAIYTDTPPSCYQGTWPNCTYWPGHSDELYEWTDTTYRYLGVRHGRDSWDNGQGVGASCPSASYHRMQASSDYGPSNFYNAAWVTTNGGNGYCGIFVGTGRSCLDVVGHEFTHGIIRSEVNFNSTFHAGAMNEGFPDVFGEFVEGWASGAGADWLHGTGGTCSPTRSLSDPPNSHAYDSNGLYQTAILPDHASMFDDGGAPHTNGGIVGKLAYLMGRPPASGSQTHWGMPVTGIGEEGASGLWYDTLVNDLVSDATFTDLREEMVDSAATTFGLYSTAYWRTLYANLAVGFWGSSVLFGFNSDEVVSAEYFPVANGNNRWLFSNINGNLGYRYRTCTYYGTCTWSSQTVLGAAASGPGSEIFSGSVWVFFEHDNTHRVGYFVLGANGQFTGPNFIPYTLTYETPTAASANNALYVFYKSPNSGVQPVYLSRFSGQWYSPVVTPISSIKSVRAVGIGANVFVFYARGSDGVLAYRVLYSNNTWSTEVSPPNWPNVGNMYGGPPGVAYYRDRLHVSDSAMLNGTGETFYASCAMPCDSASDWTPVTRLDFVDILTRWVYLDADGPADGRLYQFRQNDDGNEMGWRWKNSD